LSGNFSEYNEFCQKIRQLSENLKIPRIHVQDKNENLPILLKFVNFKGSSRYRYRYRYRNRHSPFTDVGASANATQETAAAKNAALRKAGAKVPDSFDDFGKLIEQVYTDLVNRGVIEVQPEQAPPPVPVDYAWARVSQFAI
jgi:hypothetical protein